MKLTFSAILYFACNGFACLVDPSIADVIEPYQDQGLEEVSDERVAAMQQRISNMMIARDLIPHRTKYLSVWSVEAHFKGCNGDGYAWGCTKRFKDLTVIIIVRSATDTCPDYDSLGHEMIHTLAWRDDYGDHENPLLWSHSQTQVKSIELDSTWMDFIRCKELTDAQR